MHKKMILWYTNGIPDGIPSGIPVVNPDKDSIDKYNIYIVQNENKNNPKSNEKWNEMFELFYSEYPKKQSKEKTKEWFIKHKPNEDTFNHIMYSLKKFKQTDSWKQNKGQFVPMPITFLNQKRWEDFDYKEEEKKKDTSDTSEINWDWNDYIKESSTEEYIDNLRKNHKE